MAQDGRGCTEVYRGPRGIVGPLSRAPRQRYIMGMLQQTPKRPRGRPSRWTPELIAFVKAELPERVASGSTLTKAMSDLTLGWRRLANLRQSDPEFDGILREASAYLTECELDRLQSLHLDHPDPAVAELAGKQLVWWAEKRQRRAQAAAATAEDQIPAWAVQRVKEWRKP
jgi:hypothetical protein